MSASRRQKQLERKYNSIRRLTGADEYSYLSNLSRSSSAAYRSSRSPIDGTRQSTTTSSSIAESSSPSTVITSATTNSAPTSVAPNSSGTLNIFDESNRRSFPVYITNQDYTPEKVDNEGISLDQGQIVEVLDSQNPSLWLVRTKARPPQTGYVPGSYFETPSNYYKQRKQTRELAEPTAAAPLSEEQEATLKRE